MSPNPHARTHLSRRTMIILRVNEQAEDFYEKSKELGTRAARSFDTQGREREKHRSQMTGLENIAETTLKATDVLDYIKKQMARERSGWTIPEQQFGEHLKRYIEDKDGLKVAVDAVCTSVGIGDTTEEDRRERKHVRLLLIRQLIRQVVVQFEYEDSELEKRRNTR
ncbi:MAG: hypothetical protein H0U76_09390 [Ktedonobacteraceae bacterium]|nr:hypothetical protein [Ktedonobacteraceae bacterium]